jgi:hypothetical protein
MSESSAAGATECTCNDLNLSVFRNRHHCHYLLSKIGQLVKKIEGNPAELGGGRGACSIKERKSLDNQAPRGHQ